MSFAQATLTLADGTALTGQFRDDGEGAARFEGAFTLAKGARLTDADGAVWVVRSVKQMEVARRQPPYAWAVLRADDVEGAAVEADEDDQEAEKGDEA